MTDTGTIVEPMWLFHLTREAANDEEADVVLRTYEPVLATFFKECLAPTFIDALLALDLKR